MADIGCKSDVPLQQIDDINQRLLPSPFRASIATHHTDYTPFDLFLEAFAFSDIIFYYSISDAVRGSMSTRSTILRHLDEAYTEPIRDPIWKHIYLSKPLIQIVRASAFQKLAGIKQLGPAYLVYPGATHTRLNHSLGVYHLAKRMITELLKKQVQTSLSLTGVKAFLCAALLHDLGHYPFAHSLKDLSIKEHETLTAEIIREDPELHSIISGSLNISPQMVASIIDDRIATKDAETLFFRNLLSGVLDPDKLDYLNRDAYFCGIPYGTQDIDFIFRQIYPYPPQGIAITNKGLASLEGLLFSKYLMYRYVYWHRDVRNMTAMIKKAILLGLREGIITPQNLYYLDDQEFFTLMSSHDFPPFMIVRAAERGRMYKQIRSVPFSPDIPLHRELENLDRRLEIEAQIAEKIARKLGEKVREEQVVVDVPEEISFELDLAVINRSDLGPSRPGANERFEAGNTASEDYTPYVDSEGVFGSEVVRGFTRSLRTIRLLIAPEEKLLKAANKLDLQPLA
jgi:HD superfamily phosphohydrolase